MSTPLVMVVGGGGYVGSTLMDHLNRKYMADPESRYTPKSLDRNFYGETSHANFIDDIRNVHPGYFSGYEAVINLAGLSNDPTAGAWPQLNDELNTQSPVDFLRFLASETHVRRYIYASSASLYDMCEDAKHSHATEASRLIDLDDMPPYSQSKLKAEQQLRAAAAETGMELVILRKGTIHGPSPRMRHDLIVNKLVGDALFKSEIEFHQSKGVEMYRPIVDIRDVASAYEAALYHPVGPGECMTFNISSENMSVKRIVSEVIAYFGDSIDVKVIQIPVSKVRSYRMSCRRADAILGWSPRFRLATSIPDIVDTIRSNGPERYFHPDTRNLDWMKVIYRAGLNTRMMGDFFNFEENVE